MATPEDKYYLRASYLLTKGGKFASKKVLDRVVTENGGNLDLLLKTRGIHLQGNDRKNMFKLFPSRGETDVSTWDISLLTAVLLNVFKSSLSDDERQSIQMIRYLRNDEIAHNANGSLRLDQFEDFCKDIEGAMNKICSKSNQSIQDECATLIKHCLTTCLDDTVHTEALKRQLQEIDDNFVLLLAKLDPTQNEELRSQAREIRHLLAEINSDGRHFIKVIVVESEITLSASVADQEGVDRASRIITEVVNAAIRRVGSDGNHARIREEIDKILENISKMPGVHLEGATAKCVILTFTCSSNAGLLKLFDYLESETYRERLNRIASALNEYLQRPQALFISSEMTPECLQCILDDLRPKVDSKEKRTVFLPIQIGTIAGMTYVWNLFEKDGILENLKILTKVLSSCVGTHLTVKVFLNKEQFERVLLETELAKQSSVSKVMPEVFDLEINFYGPDDSTDKGKDIFTKAFKETLQCSQIKDEYQALRLAIQLVLGQIESVEDVQVKDLKYKRKIRMPIMFESVEGMRYVWDLFEKGDSLNSLSEAVSEHVGKKLTAKASFDIEQMKTALTETDDNTEAELLRIIEKQHKSDFLANIEPEKLLNHLQCHTQSNKDDVAKTYSESGRAFEIRPVSPIPDINQNDLANIIEFPSKEIPDQPIDLPIKKETPSCSSDSGDLDSVTSAYSAEDEGDSQQTAPNAQSVSNRDVSEYLDELFGKERRIEKDIIGGRIALTCGDHYEEVTAGPIVRVGERKDNFFLTVCREPLKSNEVYFVRDNFEGTIKRRRKTDYKRVGEVFAKIQKYDVCLVKVDSSMQQERKYDTDRDDRNEIAVVSSDVMGASLPIKKIGSNGITSGLLESYPYQLRAPEGDFVKNVYVVDSKYGDKSQSFANAGDMGSAMYMWNTRENKWCCIGLLYGVLVRDVNKSCVFLAIHLQDIFSEFESIGIHLSL